MAERRRRLIEVAFPLEEVSEHSRREKMARQGHISTLHIWWARRPLAACRAFIYASLVDDPDDEKERDSLLREVADLASWDAVRKPELVVRAYADGGSGLTGRELLKRARQRILDSNNGKAPSLADPFAGGGAIPLEALRLGCQVAASDLNPVAALILKCTVEYPQTYCYPTSQEVPPYIRDLASVDEQRMLFARDAVDAYRNNPLATDVRYWGAWILARVRSELGEYYPPDDDGSTPLAYIWTRVAPCPNCGAEMPLIRQYWLARKDKKKVALKPVLDRELNRVLFDVIEGKEITGDPKEATTTRGDAVCLLCNQVVKGDFLRSFARKHGLGHRLAAVVLESPRQSTKAYRPAGLTDEEVFKNAATATERIELQNIGDLPLVPDEPIDPFHHDVNRPVLYGSDTWGAIFNPRQKLAITTLVRLVHAAHSEMIAAGLDADYATAITTYLGLAVDRFADYNSSLTRWVSQGEFVGNTFTRQALAMVWDYCEVNPASEQTGGFRGAIEWIAQTLIPVGNPASVTLADSRTMHGSVQAVITDPPYYDSINYANLSDFFYVWLKRSVGFLHPQLFSLPLTPKKDQVVMSVDAGTQSGEGSQAHIARQRYIDGMAQSFKAMGNSLAADGVVGVVFAHTDPGAWATLVEGLLGAALVPDASWPIDTEMGAKAAGHEQARLQTSVWMACRHRDSAVGEAFLGDVLSEMRSAIRERLLYFWSKGIRGADFFISAIGPALAVFGRYTRIMRPDGTEVTVRDFLDLVRRESTTVALEQVLHGADLGIVDPATRQYVTWVWSYSRAPLDAGEAIALCLATGADYRIVTRPHAIAAEAKEKSKKVVKLRTIRERGQQDEELGLESPAQATPLIDQLQRAAWLWGQNKPDELARFRSTLGETKWVALRTLGQAVAECLPDGDEDRRLINGLMSSNVMSAAGPTVAAEPQQRLEI